ncbi:ABC transporter ATP-binding protein [Tuberibacillus calidus]|jgi:ABC-2 type transport system ATP-binding protein|uniref:ABC transporter ATP-binding protein n=1 Tax=Tuberibacillus calidus TaxID=340097 RepID=UPI00041B1D49|nr:ABC transporter ATP-binding protein [Tuberibacillus calidus]
MANTGVLTVNHVSKRFGEKRVLKDVNFSIDRPEIFGLLGPSGAGKTTLIKMIAGMDQPTEGTIHVLGQKVPDLALMNKIGYMGQSDALYEELSAFENLAFFAALYGLTGKRMKERAQEVLELVGLSQDAKTIVERFSGGMKRRLSLAIALMHQPQILILDEPTVGIDPFLRQKLWETFENFRKSGVTIIVTSHVMDEAERCARLGLIRDGRLIALGTPEELKTATETNSMEEAFLKFGGENDAN